MKKGIANFNEMGCALNEMCAALSDLPEDVLFNARLVASELLSNAVQYGGGCAQFGYVRTEEYVRLCVKSVNPYRPPERSVCSAVTEERGRGLFLVDAVAERRGYTEQEGIYVFLRIKQE